METPSIRYAFYVLAETPTAFLGVGNPRCAGQNGEELRFVQGAIE